MRTRLTTCVRYLHSRGQISATLAASPHFHSSVSSGCSSHSPSLRWRPCLLCCPQHCIDAARGAAINAVHITLTDSYPRLRDLRSCPALRRDILGACKPMSTRLQAQSSLTLLHSRHSRGIPRGVLDFLRVWFGGQSVMECSSPDKARCFDA
jgi:hypothetical protein